MFIVVTPQVRPASSPGRFFALGTTLPWTFQRCHGNSDGNKLSSLYGTAVVTFSGIFFNVDVIMVVNAQSGEVKNIYIFQSSHLKGDM